MINFEELLERISKGESPQELALEMRPGPEKDLLARCALPLRFNQELYEGELRQDSSINFEDWIQSKQILEEVRNPGWFRVEDNLRGTLLKNWSRNQDRRNNLHQLLARWFGENVYWEQRLYHLAVIDEQKAIDLFNRLYAEADTAFDLSGCYRILLILKAQEDLQGHGLKELLQDRLSYLEARGMWTNEYYQTGAYLQRAGLDQKIETWLTRDENWVIQFFAKGGMGKTMFQRWLLARFCSPEPRRIPCARIDFDFVDPVKAIGHPWWLLMNLMRQLQRQIPGEIFTRIIQSYSRFESVIDQNQSLALEESDRLNQDVARRFASILAELWHKPLVIIFDTTEEIQLRSHISPTQLLAMMADIQKRFPSLRLILSGRYNLLEQYPNLAETLEGQIDTLFLDPFSPQEATEFLSHRRHLSNSDLVKIVVKRCEGIPFKLALFADILEDNPEITPEEIAAYPNVDLTYLIERVVKRIENPQVRWLLRYGVIPRKLNRDFVEQVMAPYLPDAMAGMVDLDNPQAGLPVSIKDQNIFPTNAERQSIDFDLLWQRLSQYAAENSWVSEDKNDPNLLVFHSEVVNPMRVLLRNEKIFELLHRDAWVWFQSQRDNQEYDPLDHEIIYHRFQIDPAGAIALWRQGLKKCWNPDDARTCLSLSFEFTRPEYIDQEGYRLKDKADQPLLPDGMLEEVRLMAVRCSLILARDYRTAPEKKDEYWNNAEKQLALIPEEYLGSAHLKGVGKLVQCLLNLNRIPFDSSGKNRHLLDPIKKHLFLALGESRDHYTRALIHEAIGDSEWRQASPKAVDSYKKLLNIQWKTPEEPPTGLLTQVSQKLAVLLSHLGRFEELQAHDGHKPRLPHGPVHQSSSPSFLFPSHYSIYSRMMEDPLPEHPHFERWRKARKQRSKLNLDEAERLFAEATSAMALVPGEMTFSAFRLDYSAFLLDQIGDFKTLGSILPNLDHIPWNTLGAIPSFDSAEFVIFSPAALKLEENLLRLRLEKARNNMGQVQELVQRLLSLVKSLPPHLSARMIFGVWGFCDSQQIDEIIRPHLIELIGTLQPGEVWLPIFLDSTQYEAPQYVPKELAEGLSDLIQIPDQESGDWHYQTLCLASLLIFLKQNDRARKLLISLIQSTTAELPIWEVALLDRAGWTRHDFNALEEILLEMIQKSEQQKIRKNILSGWHGQRLISLNDVSGYFFLESAIANMTGQSSNCYYNQNIRLLLLDAIEKNDSERTASLKGRLSQIYDHYDDPVGRQWLDTLLSPRPQTRGMSEEKKTLGYQLSEKPEWPFITPGLNRLMVDLKIEGDLLIVRDSVGRENKISLSQSWLSFLSSPRELVPDGLLSTIEINPHDLIQKFNEIILDGLQPDELVISIKGHSLSDRILAALPLEMATETGQVFRTGNSPGTEVGNTQKLISESRILHIKPDRLSERNDLVQFFEGNNAGITRLYEKDIDRLYHEINRGSDFILIESAFSENTNFETGLDFGRNISKVSTGRGGDSNISPMHLAKLLGSLPVESLPHFILNVSRPPGRLEQLRQFALAKIFAADLFYYSSVPSVLVTMHLPEINPRSFYFPERLKEEFTLELAKSQRKIISYWNKAISPVLYTNNPYRPLSK